MSIFHRKLGGAMLLAWLLLFTFTASDAAWVEHSWLSQACPPLQPPMFLCASHAHAWQEGPSRFPPNTFHLTLFLQTMFPAERNCSRRQQLRSRLAHTRGGAAVLPIGRAVSCDRIHSLQLRGAHPNAHKMHKMHKIHEMQALPTSCAGLGTYNLPLVGRLYLTPITP